jgi:hypothetical protein
MDVMPLESSRTPLEASGSYVKRSDALYAQAASGTSTDARVGDAPPSNRVDRNSPPPMHSHLVAAWGRFPEPKRSEKPPAEAGGRFS